MTSRTIGLFIHKFPIDLNKELKVEAIQKNMDKKDLIIEILRRRND